MKVQLVSVAQFYVTIKHGSIVTSTEFFLESAGKEKMEKDETKIIKQTERFVYSSNCVSFKRWHKISNDIQPL